MWRTVKLKDIALIKGGKRLPKGKKLRDAATPHPYLRVSDFLDSGTINTSSLKYVSTDLHKEIEKYTINYGDVYISIAGTIGKVGVIPKSLDGANLTENAAKLVLQEGCFDRYIALALSSRNSNQQILQRTRTAAQPKLSLRRLADISIPLPPLPEQQRIVAKLDAAFAEIDKAVEAIEQKQKETDGLASTIIAMGLTDTSNTAVMWKTVKLGEISAINYGYTAKASHTSGSYKFLRITDIQRNSVDWDSVPFCEVEEKKLSRVLLKDGDIVFARTGATTGKSFLVHDPVNSVFASYLIRVALDLEVAVPKYVSYFFQSAMYWEQIEDGISGAAQGGFNASKLAELDIALPPLPEQQRIVAKLDATFQELSDFRAAATNQVVHYQDLKSSILSQELQPHAA